MPRENAIARIAECGPQPYAAPPSSLGGPLGERCAVRTKPLARRTLRVRFHQQDRVVESKVGTPTKEVSQ